jgi:CelD/BcsL family acetyltransferase involved in cellulose biosynthesis
MSSIWAPQSFQLRFEISYFRFGTAQFPVLVRNGWLDYPALVHSRLDPPADGLPSGVEGFVIHSLPYSGVITPTHERDGYVVYVERQYPRYLTNLKGTFEEYSEKFSSKTRSTIKRKIKKFESHCGALVWREFRTEAQLREFYEHARVVSSTTYQEKLLENGLPATEEFQQGMIAAANADAVRAFVLYDKDRPVAYLYCPIENNDLLYSYLGYDPAYISFSTGTILQWLAFESIFTENRYRYFDFTEGEGEHKKMFGTTSQDCVTVVYLRGSFKNRLLIHTHGKLNGFAELLGRWADKLALRAKIKRILRLRK